MYSRRVFVDLHVHSAFTLLEGASLPEQLAAGAATLGYQTLALTDRDDLGGQVRFLEGARKAGIRPIVGAEITVCTGTLPTHGQREVRGQDLFGLVLLAKDAAGYANLSSLVSKSRFERTRGRPFVTIEEVAARSVGLVALSAFLDGPLGPALARSDVDAGIRLAEPWLEIFGDDFVFEVQDHTLPEEERALRTTLAVAMQLGRTAQQGVEHGVVATNHVHHLTPELKRVEDVLRCIALACTLDEAGDRLFPNDERYLRSPKVMAHRFRSMPELIRASEIIAARCTFDLGRDLIVPLPPMAPMPGDSAEGRSGDRADGSSPDAVAAMQKHLESLTWSGARQRWAHLFPQGVDPRTGPLPPPAVRYRDQLCHELDVIGRMQFAGYFLILHDIVEAAKSMHILVQGRGSAANSAVCYCLGITAIDPIGRQLLFERFLSEGRKEPPDIDLDIEHDKREQLLQYIYRRYGRDHAAMVAAIHTFQPRAATRDVARVLGFSPQQASALVSLCARWPSMDADRRTPEPPPPTSGLRDPTALRSIGLDPMDHRVSLVPELVEQLTGLPRHRGIHTGGFVLSARPIFEVCPVEWAAMPGRTVVQWEKDDLSTLGIVKFDMLGLGMLSCLARTLNLIEHYRGERLDLWQLPHDDPDVYDMICMADTVGLFQIESRAQMNTLPRLRPRQFYDLVVEVALIRPGPIQGEMIHPYLRRRRGEEPVSYLHPSLEPHLARTLGVPLFQEQGMKVAIEVAGFDPSEADRLRRAMAHKRSRTEMQKLGVMLIERMAARGIGPDVSVRIVKQLTAFADYGFPESHAASFALLVYASAYLKYHYMPEFYAAILNAQPMGFYSPGSLVEDAKRHGLEVRPPDVGHSRWDCTLEGVDTSSQKGADKPTLRWALRVGLRFVRGLGNESRLQIERALDPVPNSLEQFVTRSALGGEKLLLLAKAGALASLTRDRRQAIWEVLRLSRSPAGPLDVPGIERQLPGLPAQSLPDIVAADYRTVGLSPLPHPVSLLRAELDARGVVTARALPRCPRHQVRVAGMIICRQRPPTAKGFVFLTLEDEGGMINVIVEPSLFEREREIFLRYVVLEIDGVLDRQQDVVNVKAKQVRGLELPWLTGVRSRDFH